MPTTLTELAHALSLMRRTREACAARLEYTKAVWQVDRTGLAARTAAYAAAGRPVTPLARTPI